MASCKVADPAPQPNKDSGTNDVSESENESEQENSNTNNEHSEETSQSDSESDPNEDNQAELESDLPYYTLSDIADVVERSKPTSIVTSQSYYVPSYGVTLHFNSRIAIEYGAEIKASYSYSYEKINPIETGYEEFISIYSGTIYSTDSSVYDGINWVNKVEKATTFSGVKLSHSLGSFEINDKTLRGIIPENKMVDFFCGIDYGIQDNLEFRLSILNRRMNKLTLNFKSKIESTNVSEVAEVNSTTTYSYDKITVSVPEK